MSLPMCARCGQPYGDAIPTRNEDDLCGPCRHAIREQGAAAVMNPLSECRYPECECEGHHHDCPLDPPSEYERLRTAVFDAAFDEGRE